MSDASLPRLLLAEDDASRAAMLARALARDFECRVTTGADEALHALAEGGWDAAVVDFSLGEDGTGFLVLQAVHLLSARTARVLYSSYWSPGLALEAQRTAHAHATVDARREDFLVELARVVRELIEPADSADDAGDDALAGEWCAHAPASRRVLEELHQAAADDGPVFVHGEPGVGKHLAAQTLQRWRAERLPHADTPGAGEGPVRLIEVPPLRARREDVPELGARFLAALATRPGQCAHELTDAALAECERRDWWGNVRELHSALYRAARRAGSRARIDAEDLPGDIVPPAPALALAKNDGMLRAMLLQLRTAGSVRGAAQLAGMTRPNFKKVMARLGVLRADTWNPND